MARRQDNSFFVAFLTSLVVSIGTSLVMYLVIMPRLGPMGQRSGGRANDVMVPPVAGLQLGQARSLLSSLNLRMGLAGQRHHTKPAGVILSHTPAAGARINRGGWVKVVISLGPAQGAAATAGTPAATGTTGTAKPAARRSAAPAGMVTVPMLRNMNISKARRKLRAVGLRAGPLVYGYDEDISPNWVLRQSPAAGTKVKAGSKVKVVINRE